MNRRDELVLMAVLHTDYADPHRNQSVRIRVIRVWESSDYFTSTRRAKSSTATM